MYKNYHFFFIKSYEGEFLEGDKSGFGSYTNISTEFFYEGGFLNGLKNG